MPYDLPIAQETFKVIKREVTNKVFITYCGCTNSLLIQLTVSSFNLSYFMEFCPRLKRQENKL